MQRENLKPSEKAFACTQLSGNFASRKRKRIMFDNDVLVIQHTLSSCNKCIFIHWMNTLIITEAVLIIKGGDDRSASHFGRFAPQSRPLGCAICNETRETAAICLTASKTRKWRKILK